MPIPTSDQTGVCTFLEDIDPRLRWRVRCPIASEDSLWERLSSKLSPSMYQPDKEMGRPDETRDRILREGLAVLNDSRADVRQIAGALSRMLEPCANVEDCLWISHAWAESLLAGRTIARENFGSLPVRIRHDALWRSDSEDYKGAHLSVGIESYRVTEATRGKSQNIPAREYKKLVEVRDQAELRKLLDGLENLGLAMLILSGDQHAVLATKINGSLLIIDNSVEPGAWVKSWKEFSEEYGDLSYYVYLYPEKIHS